MSVVGPDGLGQDVWNSDGLNNSTHRSPGNDTSSGRGRLQENQTAAEPAENRVPDGRFENVNPAKVLLGRFDTLADGRGHFLGFSDAESHDFGRGIADHN